MTPMNHEKFRGNRSARISEIRNTDTQTDRQSRQLYIYRCISSSLTYSTYYSNSLNGSSWLLRRR